MSPAADNVIPLKRRPREQPRPAAAAARLALWELPAHVLCPTLGTCLSIGALRQLLDDLFQGRSDADDFALHAGVVRECGARNKVSECLQCELDLRFASDIARLGSIDDDAGLADAWERATVAGDVAGTLWAVMGHGACSSGLREHLLADLHMQQHHCIAENQRLHLAHADAEHEREQLAHQRDRLQREVDALRAECERLAGAAARPMAHRQRPRPFETAWRSIRQRLGATARAT